VEAEGIQFAHLRNGFDAYTQTGSAGAFLEKVFAPVRGGEFIVRTLMNGIEQTYVDTWRAASAADVVISNPMAYSTPIVCRELRLPWFSTALAPMFFLSVEEPPPLTAAPWMRGLHRFSPRLYGAVFEGLKRATRSWIKPLLEACEHRGVAPPDGHPLFEGQYSPHGTLAMFPLSFAQPQIDWPPRTVLTGFPVHASEMGNKESIAALRRFLDAGEAPIVFALGSSAVHIAGDFYRVGARAARALGRRAILICGDAAHGLRAEVSGDDLFIIDYVAYDKVFPEAAAIVHQGGIGTLAQAFRAMRPMLVVPFGFDQLDNAERVERLGVGRMLARRRFSSGRASAALEELLTQKCYAERARVFGARIAEVVGEDVAAAAVEALLASATAGNDVDWATGSQKSTGDRGDA
jgi:UDP:flavonoid glycosyltransferase YjiC (YdhE family)